VGDSLAQGLAPRLTELARQVGITFASSATKSTTIADWLQGAQSDLLRRDLEGFDPRYVLVSLGTNDMRANDPVAAGRRAGELAQTVLRSGAAVAWIAPPEMPFPDRGFRAALEEAVRPHGRIFDSTKLTIPRQKGDFHPTGAGYAAWADAIAAWVPFSAFGAQPGAEPVEEEAAQHLTLPRRVAVAGMVELDVDDYVARVVTGEMGGSRELQALKAQAIAARTFVCRAMRDDPKLGTPAKPVPNSESFQVASKGAKPLCAQAARETGGGVATYQGRLILANFVAGGVWPRGAWDGSGSAKTEKYVTYNQGRSGMSVIRTSLAKIDHRDNRGCLSQNGAEELARRGWTWPAILRFFYGSDIQFTIPEPLGSSVPMAGRPGSGAGELGLGLLALGALGLLAKV
jgi:lysophospholipase L1-like esterase